MAGKPSVIEVHIPKRPNQETLIDALYDATGLVMLDTWDVYIVAQNERQAHRVDKLVEDCGIVDIWVGEWEDY